MKPIEPFFLINNGQKMLPNLQGCTEQKWSYTKKHWSINRNCFTVAIYESINQY